jgi:hypothetical protein
MTDTSAKGSVKALSFASKSFDSGLYSAVAAAARLRDVKLTRQSYVIKPELYAQPIELSADLSHAYSGEPKHVHFEQDDGFVIGTYAWSVTVKQKRRQVLSHRAEYLLVFSELESKPEDYVSLYFKKISRFTSYPYFRSLFASNVMNSGIVLPPLPSLTDRVD